jgi:hypothetical protein
MLSVEFHCPRLDACWRRPSCWLIDVSPSSPHGDGVAAQESLPSVKAGWTVEQKKRPAEAGLFLALPPYCGCIAVG